MTRDALAFLAAMRFNEADLLGFSIGRFVAQQIALTRPALVRRLVLASSAPLGAAGMHGWAPEVIGAIGTPHTSPEAYLKVFFTRSAAGRQAGAEALRRMSVRTEDRDTPTTWETREARYDGVCTWGIPDHALLHRLSAIDMPVFVANGDSDPMILPHYSYLLAGLIPHARVKIYLDSAHGFLFSTTPSSQPTSRHSLPAPAKKPPVLSRRVPANFCCDRNVRPDLFIFFAASSRGVPASTAHPSAPSRAARPPSPAGQAAGMKLRRSPRPASPRQAAAGSLAAVSSRPADALDQVLPAPAEAFGGLRGGPGQDGG